MNPSPKILLALLFVFTCHAGSQPVRFAVIGDYGYAGQAEADVAALVQGWGPDFIITVGDNNYPDGTALTIDTNIGQYFHEYISPYTGSYGQGDTINRFFPALGNHDWNTAGALPYLQYFTLPGNERYYDFVKGDVHFFVLDSDVHEPDGRTSGSIQGQWLQNALAASAAQWKVVYFHHPPYSSGSTHGSQTFMQWPFKQWGASVVLAGHEHNYERLAVDGLPYIVNGLGGRSLYTFGTPLPESLFRFNFEYGAQLVEANADSMVLSFYAATGALIDRYVLHSQVQVTKQYAVQAGWNLVSLPLTVNDPRATTVYPFASSAAFTFATSGYYKADSLRYGTGYWLRFDSAQSVSITGFARTPDTISVHAGWNIIGVASSADTGTIQQVPAGVIESPYYTFTSDYVAQDTLESGKAYWVKAGSPGQLIFPVVLSDSWGKQLTPVNR